MTKCTQESFDFPPLKRHRIEARFSGGDITSDGGLLLLRQVDRRLGLLEAVNARLPDPRDARYVVHDQLTLLRQRIYALCQGYEDLNDHDQLRGDLALQTATEQEQVLGSSPTLCRLENRMGREAAVAIHHVLVEPVFVKTDLAFSIMRRDTFLRCYVPDSMRPAQRDPNSESGLTTGLDWRLLLAHRPASGMPEWCCPLPGAAALG